MKTFWLFGVLLLVFSTQAYSQPETAPQFEFNYVYVEYSCHTSGIAAKNYLVRAYSQVFAMCPGEGTHIGVVKSQPQDPLRAAESVCRTGELNLERYGGGAPASQANAEASRAKEIRDWLRIDNVLVENFYVVAPYSRSCR